MPHISETQQTQESSLRQPLPESARPAQAGAEQQPQLRRQPRGPIRLIVSDFDGTLLPESSNDLPADVVPMIHRLQKEGILFAAASGRPYENLRRLMEEVREEMIFICENGAITYEKDRRLALVPLPREAAREITEAILAEPGCEPIISGLRHYYAIRPSTYYDSLDGTFRNFRLIESFGEIDDIITKISVYRPAGIEAVRQNFARRFGRDFHAAVSAVCWQDFTVANKGLALREVCAAKGIRPEEVLVFGDNFNDIEMLEYGAYSYVREASHPQVRAAADGFFRTVPDFVGRYLEERRLPF